MKILFVLDYFTPHKGGLETVFENIIKRLMVRGHEIVVLTSKFEKKLNEIEIKENIIIYRIGQTRLQFILGAIWLGANILRKDKKINIIHTSTYGGAIPASILGLIFHKKVILTIHEIFGKLRNFYKGNLRGYLYRIFENIIFRFPYDTYHCVSTYTLNSLRICHSIADSKLKLVHNGVDTEFWDPQKINESQIKKFQKEHGLEDSILLLYYGHAGKSKGIDYLVKAIPGILDTTAKIKIIFNLINSKRKLKVRKDISKYQKKYPGRIKLFDGFEAEALRNLIACCNIVIAPSISEGFGSVHTESVAMGKTLLTTNIASIPEVVWGKVKFINPGSAEEISKGIQDILGGKINDIPAKTFSWDENVKKIEDIYREIAF